MIMAGQILSNIQFNEEKGELSYQGVRYLLIRPETIIGLQKAAEVRLGQDVGEFIYNGGRIGGTLSVQAYSEKLNLSPEGIVDFMAQMGGELGWGHLEVERLDREKKVLIIKAHNSAFAQAYGRSREGVCHLIRGVFAGVAEFLLGGPVEARETLCKASGDHFCRFEFWVVESNREIIKNS